jgi:hypothetical protein
MGKWVRQTNWRMPAVATADTMAKKKALKLP